MDPGRLAELVGKELKEELREDMNTREQSLEQFREWIIKHPDIRDCPTDDSFLLPFLRARKYSMPRAQDTLLRLLKFQHNFPELNTNLTVQDPDIDEVFSSGEIFGCGVRTSSGQGVGLFIPRNADTKRQNYLATSRAIVLSWHAAMLNEATQVLGTVIIYDMDQAPASWFTMFPVAVVRALSEGMEKSFPIRVKKMHVFNMPAVATWFFKIILAVISEKMRNRVMFHSSLEELHQHVDPSVLPKEYGGNIPMKEKITLWKQEVALYSETIRAITNAKLVGDTAKNLMEHSGTGIPELPGSFRKLQVD